MSYFEYDFDHTKKYQDLKQIYENKNNFSNIKLIYFKGILQLE